MKEYYNKKAHALCDEIYKKIFKEFGGVVNENTINRAQKSLGNKYAEILADALDYKRKIEAYMKLPVNSDVYKKLGIIKKKLNLILLGKEED
jgi:hypothetical protein